MKRKDITLHVAPEALMALALILEMKLDEWDEDPQKELYMLMPDLIDEFKYTIDEMTRQGTLASKIFGKYVRQKSPLPAQKENTCYIPRKTCPWWTVGISCLSAEE